MDMIKEINRVKALLDEGLLSVKGAVKVLHKLDAIDDTWSIKTHICPDCGRLHVEVWQKVDEVYK